MRDTYRNSEIVPPLYVVDGNQDDDAQITIAEVTARGVEVARFAWSEHSWQRIGLTPYASVEGMLKAMDALSENLSDLRAEECERLSAELTEAKGTLTANVDCLERQGLRAEADKLRALVDGHVPVAQHDKGALVYLREAVVTLREMRDKHGNKADKYDLLARVAQNTRDLFEWLYPYCWCDDPEFVPFKERAPA